MDAMTVTGCPSKRVKVKENPAGEQDEGEEDLMMQYQRAELPAPPSPVQSTGVLQGKEVSVSFQFSREDQQTATKVITAHGG